MYLEAWQRCAMEGCRGKGNCPDCGQVNYRLLGYYGAVARWAKAWKVSEAEAERIMEERALERYYKMYPEEKEEN